MSIVSFARISSFFLAILLISCLKQQSSNIVFEDVAADLQLSDSVDLRLVSLLEKVGEEDYTHPFLGSIKEKYGNLLWEQGIWGNRSSTIVYAIPLKLSGASKLSGFIIFELDDSLKFRIYENTDFLKYGFSDKQGDVSGARVQNLAMALTARVFDTNEPDVPQEPCFQPRKMQSQWQQLRLANPNIPLQISSRIYQIETCYSWSTCMGDGSGNCVGEVYYFSECITQTFWLDDGGGSTGYGGGSGGYGGGGTNTGIGNDPGGSDNSCPGSPDATLNPVHQADILFIPCPSSFNLVRQGNWQSAVITDYKFGLYNRSGNHLDYKINIGNIEVGLPYVTYDGSIIQASIAQSMATQAATLAEGEVAMVLNAFLIANPHILPHQVNYAPYKVMFKHAYESHLNLFLRSDYYGGQNVSPSRVSYDASNFSLKDPTKYRSLKFRGRDC